MTNTRKVINPHDEITIDYSDVDAARLAVLIIGSGAYCIENDAMPILCFGGVDEFFTETYKQSWANFCDNFPKERIAMALESLALPIGRTSMNDPVGYGHKVAKILRETVKKA